MNYLFRYLTLLTREEIAAARAVDLAPRERSVLEALIARRSDAEARREVVLDELAISSTAFDKTCSIVLRRVYAALVPAGGTRLLYDLQRRALHANFVHELRRQEKALSAAAAEERATFYMECFTLLLRGSRDTYDEALMAELAQKYDRLHPSPDNEVYFEACLISGMIWDVAARAEQSGMIDAVRRRLEANEARITAATGALAEFKQCHARALFHSHLDERPAERMRSLERSAELCRLHPDLFSREELVLAECRIAESHYFNSSDFATAYRHYARLFRDHADILRRDFYHTTKFIQLCIIRGRHARAAKLLHERFELHLGSEHDSIGTMGAISWAKLHLATGHVDEARRSIEFGMRHNRKNLYVQYEIELRLLETIAFAMAGDDEFVERLIEKNAKYLRSKGFSLETSRYYPWALKLLAAFIDERVNARPLPERLASKLEEFDEGPAAVYGLLLRRVRAALPAVLDVA